MGVLVWFWLRFWQGLCLVPFRGSGDGDSRADVPELHAGVAAEGRPDPGAPSPARSCWPTCKEEEVLNVN